MVSSRNEKTPLIVALLALAGVLFAGYLSFSKIILKQCALNEGCNYLFGIPTCLIGFVLFLLIFILALLRLRDSSASGRKNYSRYIHWVAGFGVLFSGYYSIVDVFFPVIPGLNYQLILPSCVYGFFVFVLVFLLNRKIMK